MSWVSQLYKTYENNIGRGSQGASVALTPIAHIYANAQLEISISAAGEFIAAAVVEKKQGSTLIPVTESSAGRSSGTAPHALCDTLSYIAGDFGRYCRTEAERKRAENRFGNYRDHLRSWVESPYSHPKAAAVFAYISRKEVMADLIAAGVAGLTEEGVYDKAKISGQPYEKVLVRFRVLPGDPSAVWEDDSLIRIYTDYYLANQKGIRDICYVTGRESVISENHPKGIVAAHYGAKLVSANDAQGYTYRGLFLDSRQAYALSYEASQKIHSALTWLVKVQGSYVGNKDKRTFLCWNPGGKKTPDMLDMYGFADEDEDTGTGSVNLQYRRNLRRILQGYRSEFEKDDEIIVMSLDAATTGRLSITYYNELQATDFFARAIHWSDTCQWSFQHFTEKKKRKYITETPTFRRIVECALGQGKFLEVNDKVLKEQTQRLLKCMLEQQPVPFDLIHLLTLRASQPLAFSRENRERVLSTACAMIRKYYLDRNLFKGGGEMKLDLENRDRSYLFGRLLAVLEKVERATYEKGEKREPNAIRLQSAYVNHPQRVWKTLEEAVNPYYRKLPPASREYYRRLETTIITQLLEEDYAVLNQGLSEMYLLGYYLQRAELNKRKEKAVEENEDE